MKKKKKFNNNVCHFYAHRVGKVRADQKCLRIKSAKEVQLLDQEIVTQFKPLLWPEIWNRVHPDVFSFNFLDTDHGNDLNTPFWVKIAQNVLLLLPVSLWSGQIT